MINPKELKIGDEVWLAGISFGKAHSRCSMNTRPTKGYVSKMERDTWHPGYYITISDKPGADIIDQRILYVVDSYAYTSEEDKYLFKTKEEAIEEYNKQVNEELDLLQSLIDKHKKKLIK